MAARLVAGRAGGGAGQMSRASSSESDIGWGGSGGESPYHRDFYGRKPNEQRAVLEVSIREAEERLRTLLEAGVDEEGDAT